MGMMRRPWRWQQRSGTELLVELGVRLNALEALIREDIRLRQYENIYQLRQAIKRTRASMGTGL